MKRIISLALVLALALSLAACGGGSSLTPEETETLIRTTGDASVETGDGKHDPTGTAVGYARADVSPTVSMPLSGYGNTSLRMSKQILDPLYLSCVALSDGENMLLYYQIDVSAINAAMDDLIRRIAVSVAGVPEENILVNASHTHSGPDYSGDAGSFWLNEVSKAARSITKAAVEDLDHCTAECGQVDTDRLNFTRRYFAEDGFVSDNFDNRKSGGKIVAHEFDADPQIQWIRFKRDNQKDVVLVNWQCHPHRTGGPSKTDISSDIVGIFRQDVEKDLGVNMVYFQGGAGNINPTTRLENEARYTEYHQIGRALANTLIDAWDTAKPIELGKVGARKTVFAGKVNHEKDYLLDVATQVNEIFKTENDKTKAMAIGAPAGLSSVYEASSIIARSKMGETLDAPLYAYAFGDFALVSAPLEMFSNTGQALKAASPFAMTFYLGYANGHNGYMPAAECYPHLGYEVVISRYVMGTAEEISEIQLSMLNDLYAN